MIRAMVTSGVMFGSAVLLVLLTGCGAKQHQPHDGTDTASYSASSARLIADARALTWGPACGRDQDSQCGMLVHADWRNELNRACETRRDLTQCAANWFDQTERKLEARYGSTTDKARATCGFECRNPFFLELEMMRAHNQRIAAQVREALQRAHLESARGSHDDTLHRQLLGSLESSMSAPRTCSSSAECPFDSTCRLDAGNVDRGFCAAY